MTTFAQGEKGKNMRLIDADALMPNAEYKGKYDTVNAYDIVSCPAVDAVEVVRCKDCKHYWKNNPSDDVPVCLASPRDDAFCSEGERIEK